MLVVGFVLGPVHLIVMDEVGRILPRWLRTGAIGWIGAVGTTSSRVAPIVVSLLICFWGMLVSASVSGPTCLSLIMSCRVFAYVIA
jgi:hypothetical protein